MKHATYDFNQNQTLTHTYNLSLRPKLQQALWIWMQSTLLAMILVDFFLVLISSNNIVALGANIRC